MPNPWDRPQSSAQTGAQGNPWDRPATAVADAPPAPHSAPPPPSYIGKPGVGELTQGPAPGIFDRLRSMVANGAIGHSLEESLPYVADKLGLRPTETVNSPTYESDKEQLLAPQELMPGNPRGHMAGIAKGVLTGTGKLTSGGSLALGAGIAATGGLAAGVAPVATGLKIGAAGLGAKGVAQGLYGAGKAYSAGDSAQGDEQLGEVLPNAALLAPLGVEAARRAPEAVRSVLAGDIHAPIPGQGGMTAADRYGAMRRVGVQPNAADATNSPVLQTLRRWNDNSASGAHAYEANKGANLAALSDTTDQVLEGMSPLSTEEGGALIQTRLRQPFVDLQDRANDQLQSMSPLGRGQGGAKLQGKVQGWAQTTHDEAENEYGGIAKLHAEVPIANPATVSNEADDILAKNSRFSQQMPSLVNKKVMNVVGDASRLGADDPILGPPRVGDFMRTRSALLDLARDPDVIKSAHMADVQRMIGANDRAIMDSLPPEAQQSWRQANAKWEDLKNTVDTPASPFYNAMRTQNPSTLVDGIGGPTPEAVDALRRIGGQESVGIVQRGVAEKMLGRNKEDQFDLKGFGKRRAQTPAEFREKLFTNEQNEQLERLATEYAEHEPYHAAAYDAAPEALAQGQGLGPQTGSAVRALAPRIGEEGMGALQRGFAEKLLRTDRHGQYNFPVFGGRLNNVPEHYLAGLYGEGPGGTARLRDIATTANTLDFNPNRSGTAHQLQRAGEVGASAGALFSGHPLPALGAIGYNAGQYGLSRAMNSPRFVEWLMNPKEKVPYFGSRASQVGTAASAAQQEQRRKR